MKVKIDNIFKIWSSSAKGMISQHAVESGVSTPFINKQLGTQVQGGGNRFIQHIKTYMFDTELLKPQEGDNSCVSYHKFVSKFKNSLKTSVRSLSDIFTCPLIQHLQQTYMVAIGHNLLTTDSLDRQLPGIPLAVVLLISIGLRWVATMMKIRIISAIGATLEVQETLERRTVSIISCMSVVLVGLFSHITDYLEKLRHIPQAPYRFIETYIAGIGYHNLVGGLV